MIVSGRVQSTSTFRGMNVLVFRDWVLPIELLPDQVFEVFDKSLLKLRTDPDATKIIDLKNPKEAWLTRLNTATQSAQRCLQERFHDLYELYTVAVFRENDRPYLWTNFPSWVPLVVETNAGELDVLENSGAGPERKWRRVDLSQDDRWIHLEVFAAQPGAIRLDPDTGRFHVRAMQAIDVALRLKRPRSLSLELR